MILADDGQGRDDARRAARLVGLMDLPEVRWADAAADLAGGCPAVLIVEAAGVADAVLARALPAVAELAGGAVTSVVVALETGQIDLVSAFLLDHPVQLLCEPTIAERVTALATVRTAGSGGRLSEGGRDDEAERLADLAREMARIGAVLTDLATRRDPGGAVADRKIAFVAPPTATETPPVTAAEVRGAIRARRLRDAEFGPGWFEDPAWDMLLDLFAADLEGARVSVSSLCIAAAVAPTTALRWIAKMTGAGLLVREDDARDRRRAFMRLSDRARSGMIRHAAAARRAGVPID